jgi:hypothetical protein
MDPEQERGKVSEVVPRRRDAINSREVRKAKDANHDIILHSAELKRLVRKQLKEHGMRLFAVCEEASVSYERIKRWLNSNRPMNTIVSQREVIDLCNEIGVDVRITLVVSSTFTAPEHLKHRERIISNHTTDFIYKEIIENEHRQAKEKGFGP